MTASDPVELLIVEDNPNDLELTLRALKKCAVAPRIHVAKDGAEALEYLFSGQKPRVIFLDMKLPKVDGKEVLRQLKSDDRTRCIPVVMLTSSQQERDVAESYSLGANSYIVKPVDFTKFADAIAELGLYWLAMNLPLR